jgi:hypothetical protein
MTISLHRKSPSGLTQITFETRTRDVLGSNFGLDTSYFGEIFRGYLQADVGTVPDLGHDRFLPNPFQFIIRRYIVYLLTASQNIRSKEKGSSLFS